MEKSNLPMAPARQWFRVVPFLAGAAAGVAATLALVGLYGDRDSAEETADAQRPTLGIPRKADSSRQSGYSSLSPQQASAGLELALRSAGARTKESELDSLIDRAAGFDAPGSFETALSLTDPERRRDALQRVLRTWVVDDRESALAAIAQVGNVALRRDLLRSAVGSLSHSDPEDAVAVLRATPSLRDDSLWQESFSIWAKADPQAALSAWRSLDHPEEIKDALRGIANTLVSEDLPAALLWADRLGAGAQEQALAAVFHRAAESNPALAAQHIDLLAKVDDERARDVIAEIAEEWAENDLPAALAWVEELPIDQKERAMGEIAGDLVRVDPDVAEAMAREIGDSSARRELFSELARLRVQADPAEAIAWIDELPAGDQLAAWHSAATEWSRTRPDEAAQFALSGELDIEVRDRLLESAMPRWARIDPAAAADWALAVPGNQGDNALSSVVSEWSRRDPESAIGFLSEATAGEQQNRLIRRAISSVSQTDPREAAGFAAELEPGETQSAIFRDVTERWMRVDSMAASEWVATLEPGDARDSAVSSLVMRIERVDLNSAVLWADSISDTRRRDETLRRLQRRLESEG